MPVSYTTKDGLRLGVWVRNQKQTYANGMLQPEKAERLESIGILWEQSNFDFKWNAAYEAAKLYFEENGNLNVPIGYTTPDGIAWESGWPVSSMPTKARTIAIAN